MNYLHNFSQWFEYFKRDTLFLQAVECVENNKWHREDNVGIHIDLAVKELCSHFTELDITKSQLLSLLALSFHDIGKKAAITRNQNERHSEMGSKGHENISARMWDNYALNNFNTLQTLFDITKKEIYAVSVLIQEHSWYLISSNRGSNVIYTLEYLGITDAAQTYFDVLMADQRGRISDKDVYESNISQLVKWCKNVSDEYEFDGEISNKNKKAHIMVGAPGSGKSTYSDRCFPKLPVWSLDALRIAWYSDKKITNEKVQYEHVWNAANADKEFEKKANIFLSALMEHGPELVVDNMNSSTKRRLRLAKQLYTNGFSVTSYVFLNSLDTILQRNETRNERYVKPELLINIYYKLSFPLLRNETTDIVII